MEKLVVRGSEVQDFLTCKKRWYHAWYEQIEPKRPDNKLFFGTLFHKFLELYYDSGCNYYHAVGDTYKWLQEQDTSGMEQTEIDELTELFDGVALNYMDKYEKNDEQFTVLATELEFIIHLGGEIYYTGTIDLVYMVNGKIRFADHKTVSSLSTYIEKSKMDRQISRYWWALEQLSKGTGMIKDDEGNWTPWYGIAGMEIDGFDYNLIAKDFPKVPELLKKGSLSVAKNQKVSYNTYKQAIAKHDLNEEDYREYLDYLKSKPDTFLHREDVKRNERELTSSIYEFWYTARDIRELRNKLDENDYDNEEMTYRNIGEHCMYMCNFRSLCQTTIEGGNVSLVRNLTYKNKEGK